MLDFEQTQNKRQMHLCQTTRPITKFGTLSNNGRSELLELVGAAGDPGAVTGSVERGEQHGDENSDDCNNDLQFNQCKKRIFHKTFL